MAGRGGRLAPGLSVIAYAKHRGVTRQAVYKALEKGWIERNEHKKLDPYTCDQAWDRATSEIPERHVQARNGGKTTAPAAVSKRVEFRERLDKAKAQQAELSLLERRRALVPAADVALLWHTAAALLRRQIRQLPARIADRVAAMSNEDEVRRFLESELDKVLTELADEAPGLARKGG